MSKYRFSRCPSRRNSSGGWGSRSLQTVWRSDARTGSFFMDRLRMDHIPGGLIALGPGERHRLLYPFFRVRGGLNHLLFRLSCFVA